jgi:hypothetical protein
MKSTSLLLRPFRFLVVVFACSLIILSSSLPAFALGSSSKSKPSDGVVKLDKIEQRAEDAMKTPLAPSADEARARANERGSINELQGAADINKMNRPSNSQDATTAKDRIEKALDKVTGD